MFMNLDNYYQYSVAEVMEVHLDVFVSFFFFLQDLIVVAD